ncbi:MBL fold metallo-hydrolase [Microbacterium sp. H1-D42]|uniref:MBL fold metallo-hydrolase n=1 Tax=Microbacterium sp. H1-D42 TaxID=2925844 RepID=UPI001F537CB0|nr:MBL fold metallo-hydrolase [Microbacterium sp. H1-D42]UNK71516.1 MBL fold metallo-hydrolase [Microbacterium sp. H1-D42]
MKLAPHLHRLGNDIVASYLVDLPGGITLIDAGLPGHWNDLQRELEVIGRPLADVRGLVLTHGDSDHIGFAERLRVEAGVPVYIHAADAHRARTGEKPKTPMGPARIRATLGFFAYGLRKNALRTRYVQEVVEVADGDVLDLPGAPVVIGMPGHSPGSIAVHIPAVDAVFVGDALTTRHVLTGREGAQPAPFTDEPAEALASLDRLASLPATWVLPGHGAPWHGSPTDIAASVRAA